MVCVRVCVCVCVCVRLSGVALDRYFTMKREALLLMLMAAETGPECDPTASEHRTDTHTV